MSVVSRRSPDPPGTGRHARRREGPTSSEGIAAPPTLTERLETRAVAAAPTVRGRNPVEVAIAFFRQFSRVRVPGLAAEMTYYLTLSLLPLVTALGASLGLVGRVLGSDTLQDMRDAVTDAVKVVLGPRFSDDVVEPVLDQLLSQRYSGWALAGVLVALFLGSRVVRSTLSALGDAVETPERRAWWRLWLLSLGLTVLAVTVVTAVVALVVVGPLLGVGQRLAGALGAGSFYTRLWSLGRWPVAVLVMVAFLVLLYRLGQRGATTWRATLPGAVVAAGALVALSAGFRTYLSFASPQTYGTQDGSGVVAVAGLVISTALAVMLLGWLASIVVISGGILNVELTAARRREPVPEPAPRR